MLFCWWMEFLIGKFLLLLLFLLLICLFFCKSFEVVDWPCVLDVLSVCFFGDNLWSLIVDLKAFLICSRKKVTKDEIQRNTNQASGIIIITVKRTQVNNGHDEIRIRFLIVFLIEIISYFSFGSFAMFH